MISLAHLSKLRWRHCDAGSAFDAVCDRSVPLPDNKVLRLVSGDDVSDELAMLGAYTARQVDRVRLELLHWISCAGKGVQAIWRTSHLHGDPKLENCLLSSEGAADLECYQEHGGHATTLRLADLGSCVRTYASEGHRAQGVHGGTEYMPPPEERPTSGQRFRTRAGEIWSFACIGFDISVEGAEKRLRQPGRWRRLIDIVEATIITSDLRRDARGRSAVR